MRKFIRHFYFFALALTLQPLTGGRLAAMDGAAVPVTDGTNQPLSTATTAALDEAMDTGWGDDSWADWEGNGNGGNTNHDQGNTPMFASVMTPADYDQHDASAPGDELQASPHELPSTVGDRHDGVRGRKRAMSCAASVMGSERHEHTTTSRSSSVGGEDGDGTDEEEEDVERKEITLTPERQALVAAALAAAKEALRSAPRSDGAEPVVDLSAVGEILEGAHFSRTDAALAVAIIKCIAMADLQEVINGDVQDGDDEHSSASSAQKSFTPRQQSFLREVLSSEGPFDQYEVTLPQEFDAPAIALIKMIVAINKELNTERASREGAEKQQQDRILRRSLQKRTCPTCREAGCCCCGVTFLWLVQQVATWNPWG